MSRTNGSPLRKGQALLHQQCWNWGRDIVRPEGNLLLEAGFHRRRPPEGEDGSSCYILELPAGGRLMVWGFGLFYGTAGQGGVYLERYRFQPQWMPLEAVQESIWAPAMVPDEQTPPSPRIPLELTAAAARRLADYEDWVLECCGLDYRCAVMRQWKQAAKGVPPQTLPQAWRGVAEAIGEKLQRTPKVREDDATVCAV